MDVASSGKPMRRNFAIGGEQIQGVAVPAGQGQNVVGRTVKEEGA